MSDRLTLLRAVKEATVYGAVGGAIGGGLGFVAKFAGVATTAEAFAAAVVVGGFFALLAFAESFLESKAAEAKAALQESA
jgi:hypothetical protein